MNINLFSEEKCKELFDQLPPSETFNRYLYEQITQDPKHRTTKDPVLCWPEASYETKVIRREIESVMPCRFYTLTPENIKTFYQFEFSSFVKWIK